MGMGVGGRAGWRAAHTDAARSFVLRRRRENCVCRLHKNVAQQPRPFVRRRRPAGLAAGVLVCRRRRSSSRAIHRVRPAPGRPGPARAVLHRGRGPPAADAARRRGRNCRRAGETGCFFFFSAVLARRGIWRMQWCGRCPGERRWLCARPRGDDRVSCSDRAALSPNLAARPSQTHTSAHSTPHTSSVPPLPRQV